MRVDIEVVPRGPPRTLDLPPGATVLQALEVLSLPPDAYVVFRGEGPIPVDEPLLEGDDLRAVLVVSGGCLSCGCCAATREAPCG